MSRIRWDRVDGARFALLADTHDDLVEWPAALAAIRGAIGEVDGVIHCGDLSSPAAIEGLSAIAPLWGVRSAGDPPEAPPVLIDGPRVIEAGEVRIGVVCSLALAPVCAETDPNLRFTECSGAEAVERLFGQPVDICVFGGTHRAEIVAVGGVVFVNPGSPTLAKRRSVAVLTVDGAAASIDICNLG
ncbi:MAG TPA: metallophosphoesterase family protein [Caulobacteraceae bacterium]|jgi:hypothetical protein|nr:metallophosphoesterase family protein [Caulobacteraceae bacterium]